MKRKTSSFLITASTFLFACTSSKKAFSDKDATWQFDFGNGQVQSGFIQVLPSTVYTDELGYGFDFDSQVFVSAKAGNEANALRTDFITSPRPFYFSAKVPEGNYNVQVILGDENGTSTTTIKTENRRLLAKEITSGKGKFATEVFTVHVRDSFINNTSNKVRLKPREKSYLHWDNKLTLEFNNKDAKVCAVQISPVHNIPTVFLAGNSTVVDQAEEPWAAWGQMIPSFFKGGTVAVANYAESGETLKAFKAERRLEKIWSLAKPGDYLFIEFAHNDQKPGGNHLDPFTTYKQTLKEWIAEAKKRKVIPVLLTSMHRRSFDAEGKIVNTLLQYPEAVRQVGREEGVAVIDLNAMSKTLYEAWGPEASKNAFVHFPANTFPGQITALQDDTHFSTYGAYQLAKCVVKGIRESNLPLKKYIKEGIEKFDPAKPEPFEQWHLPASAFITTTKPDGN